VEVKSASAIINVAGFVSGIVGVGVGWFVEVVIWKVEFADVVGDGEVVLVDVDVGVGVAMGGNVAFGSARVQSLLIAQSLAVARGTVKNKARNIMETAVLFKGTLL